MCTVIERIHIVCWDIIGDNVSYDVSVIIIITIIIKLLLSCI